MARSLGEGLSGGSAKELPPTAFTYINASARRRVDAWNANFSGASGSSSDLVSVETLPPNARLEIWFILPSSLAILAKEIRGLEAQAALRFPLPSLPLLSIL